ncbi:hypothetical protein [Rufibacter psychrotolerans]|uniref:hypothetical protein n=1 Tax=Rufibacter psychrotolerans TaxID=2812556 RepID=UPI0019686F3B|nr:hypothetical protein [Rufibacter sp. SYSU D00308]
MKKLFLFIALFTLPVLGFAQTQPKKQPIPAQVKLDEVKMYRQPGTCAEVLTSLKTTDDILYHRRHNTHWAIVSKGDMVGYILYDELTNAKPKPQVVAMEKKRK